MTGVSLALAVDLGATKVEAALVRPDGTIVPGTRHRAPTGSAVAASAEAGRAALAEVLQAVSRHAEFDSVAAAGVGSAGPVDLGEGTVAPINLPALRDFPITDVVAQLTGVADVTLRLDGTCIALAEHWRGAARGVSDAIVLIVSTGIGAGLVSGGRVVTGRTGNAGHLGQVVVDGAAAHPRAGTVEALGSGPSAVAWARTQGWDGTTGEDLAAACAAGDQVATAAVRRSARAVGLGLVNAATLLDLELGVIGGGFAQVTPGYCPLVAETVRSSAVNAYAAQLAVVPAALGTDAPLVGAAALVHRRDLLGD